jgi:hypothetical protein
MSDPGVGAPPPGGEERAPTPEELMAELAIRLGRTPVRDVLLQSMATFTDLAGIRLGMGPEGMAVADLGQAKLAIESLRALYAVAEAELGAAQARPFREPLAQLQLAFAQAAEAGGAAAAGGGPGAAGERPGSEGPAPRGPDPADKLWVPPGARRKR